MTNIIIFEGANEIIVTTETNVNKTIELWFLNGLRNLDEYDVYSVGGDETAAFSTRFHSDGDGRDYDVTELMPDVLRNALIEAELLTDEG